MIKRGSRGSERPQDLTTAHTSKQRWGPNVGPAGCSRWAPLMPPFSRRARRLATHSNPEQTAAHRPRACYPPTPARRRAARPTPSARGTGDAVITAVRLPAWRPCRPRQVGAPGPGEMGTGWSTQVNCREVPAGRNAAGLIPGSPGQSTCETEHSSSLSKHPARCTERRCPQRATVQ